MRVLQRRVCSATYAALLSTVSGASGTRNVRFQNRATHSNKFKTKRRNQITDELDAEQYFSNLCKLDKKPCRTISKQRQIELIIFQPSEELSKHLHTNTLNLYVLIT
ncbi:hypothetical protein AVEN_64498-1 [Araneus ventricosus]|uniref:Uncharacterized protein n=1 Tax=Araneus ventricosus TaxID=182803 RepID=A0A4Y2IPG0_ARAVE|nr:hypothetical protein AVEN_64498-1 [Araneus ventricosus]